MQSEILTDFVQSRSADVVGRLPDEALVVLTTDPKADCRPRLYIHDRHVSPAAYVLKYRCRDGNQLQRRSVYLGPLRESEVEHMRLLLATLRSPTYLDVSNRSFADRERDIRAARTGLRNVLKDATEFALLCGFHIRGRRVYRIGAVGVRAERQAQRQGLGGTDQCYRFTIVEMRFQIAPVERPRRRLINVLTTAREYIMQRELTVNPLPPARQSSVGIGETLAENPRDRGFY